MPSSFLIMALVNLRYTESWSRLESKCCENSLPCNIKQVQPFTLALCSFGSKVNVFIFTLQGWVQCALVGTELKYNLCAYELINHTRSTGKRRSAGVSGLKRSDIWLRVKLLWWTDCVRNLSLKRFRRGEKTWFQRNIASWRKNTPCFESILLWKCYPNVILKFSSAIMVIMAASPSGNCLFIKFSFSGFLA